VIESKRSVWPRSFPTYALMGIGLSVLAGRGMLELWGQKHLIQRFYIWPATWTSIYAGQTARDFPVLFGDGKTGKVHVSPRAFHQFLVDSVYDRQPVTRVLQVPLSAFMVVLLTALMVGMNLDDKYNQRARAGRLIEGPRELSRWRFNRLVKGDGIGIRTTMRRNFWEWLSGPSSTYIRIKREDEAQHIQICGVQGSGKTTLQRMFLYQVEQRREHAIVLDPAKEFIEEFHDGTRGDIILNPLDERCPYWALEREADTEADATGIGMALWPDSPNEQPFFRKHPRNIFSYLITRFNLKNAPAEPATCANLGRWLANPRVEITKRLAGTEHAVATDPSAKDQSQGLWAGLGEIAKPLRLMPATPEGRGEWTVKDWCRNPHGWIFITSTPKTLDSLRPIQTLWLDMLTMGLQENTKPARSPKVWLFLDEISSINQMPQLEAALTRQRKSGNPIVLGMQSMSQINALYTKEVAKTILSQAKTNIVLATREPEAAEHQSALIGKRKVERIQEQRPYSGGSRGRSNSTQVAEETAVHESVIQGLDNLQGFFVQTGKFVRITFFPFPKRQRAQGFIPRKMEVSTIPDIPAGPVLQSATVHTVAEEKFEKGTPTSSVPEIVMVNGEARELTPWRGEEELDLVE
jgi:hypothetical protein